MNVIIARQNFFSPLHLLILFIYFLGIIRIDFESESELSLLPINNKIHII